jgi:hypothetical protein
MLWLGLEWQATPPQTALFLSSLKIMIILLYLWFFGQKPIQPDEENQLAAASRPLLWDDNIRTGDSSTRIFD